MKILIITPRLPYPPIEGMRIKSYHLIKELDKRGYEIILVSNLFDPSDVDESNILNIAKYVKRLDLINYSTISTELLNRILERFYIPSKDLIARIKSDKNIDYIIKLIQEEQPEIVQYDFIHSLNLIETNRRNATIKNTPFILSLCDTYSLVLRERIRQGIDTTFDSLARWIYTLLSYPIAVNLEKKLHMIFQRVQVVSEHDAEWLRTINPLVNLAVIPNGVDIDYFRPMEGISEEEKMLIMVANFKVDEHVNNAIWFITRVFKRLKMIEPKVKLYLVGKDPPVRLIKLAKSIGDVIITGYVPDIRPYIMRASLVIDARQERFGILNHVLQAMSMGKCVVGKKYSFLAIDDIEPWRNAVIARDENDFVIKIAYLLNDETTRKNIGDNARKLIEANYTWGRIVLKYEDMYKQTISDKNYQ